MYLFSPPSPSQQRPPEPPRDFPGHSTPVESSAFKVIQNIFKPFSILPAQENRHEAPPQIQPFGRILILLLSCECPPSWFSSFSMVPSLRFPAHCLEPHCARNTRCFLILPSQGERCPTSSAFVVAPHLFVAIFARPGALNSIVCCTCGMDSGRAELKAAVSCGFVGLDIVEWRPSSCRPVPNPR